MRITLRGKSRIADGSGAVVERVHRPGRGGGGTYVCERRCARVFGRAIEREQMRDVLSWFSGLDRQITCV